MSRKPTSSALASSHNVNRSERPLCMTAMTVTWKVNLVAHESLDVVRAFSITGLPVGALVAAIQSCGSRGTEMLPLDAAEGMMVGIDRTMSYTAEACVFTARAVDEQGTNS